MIALDNGDKIRGDAAAATVVDYTLHGSVGSTITQLADGQLASSIGDLYTAGASDIAVHSIVLVNTDTSARAVNLYLTPSGGTARRLIPKDLSLGVGHSLHTNGEEVNVHDATGNLLVKYTGHASTHTDGTDDIQDAAADGSTKGISTFTATDFNDSSGNISLDFTNAQKASTSQAGFLTEVATAAETTTGTDSARAVSPDGLAGSDYGKRVVGLLVFDDSQDVETGDGAGDVFFRVPSVYNGWNLVDVEAQVQTAGTTNTTNIQIHNVTDAADMLSTVITIDSGEKDSSTAATAPVIDTGNDDVATADSIRIDVDQVSTTAPKGLYIELTFQLP